MRHTNLKNCCASELQTNEELSREECAIRVHTDASQRVAPEKFRRAVNIANTKSEPNEIGNAIEGGVYETQWRVGTLHPIANDNRRACDLCTFDKARKVGDAELAVAVGVGKVVIPRCSKT
jgi:hypothetical protein